MLRSEKMQGRKTTRFSDKLSSRQHAREKIVVLLGTKLFQSTDLSVPPIFFSFCWLSLVAFGEFIFQKRVTNQLSGWEFCVLQQDTFYLRQDEEQNIFVKKSHSCINGCYVLDGNIVFFTKCSKLELLNQILTKKILFQSNFQPLYNVMHREIENLEFVQCVNFEIIDSSKNNVTKHLLIFDIKTLS